MSFIPRERFQWRLRTRTLPLGERTRLMAIVNLTPDSFSGDGLLATGQTSLEHTVDVAVSAAVLALEEGADLLDLGAESTRPGADPLSSEEEQQRLLPALEALVAARPDAIVSVDTYHAATARAAAEAGAEIINDVSGLEWDPAMAQVVMETQCGVVLTHTRGRPGEWRSQPALAAGDVLPVVFAGLCERLALAEAAGIPSECIVVDPGFGFGKRGKENLELLVGMERLAELGRPLLAGLSRKRFLSELFSTAPNTDGTVVQKDRRVPSVAGNVAAVLAGAHLVRVHDVAETRQALAVVDAILAGAGATSHV